MGEGGVQPRDGRDEVKQSDKDKDGTKTANATEEGEIGEASVYSAGVGVEAGVTLALFPSPSCSPSPASPSDFLFKPADSASVPGSSLTTAGELDLEREVCLLSELAATAVTVLRRADERREDDALCFVSWRQVA